MKNQKSLAFLGVILVFLSFLVGCEKPSYLRPTQAGGDDTPYSCIENGHKFENEACTVCNASYSTELEFRLSESGEYYVIHDGHDCKDEYIIIPEEYNGKPVKMISDGAFYYCETVKRVYIPASIEVIEAGAFHRCYRLQRVIFAEDSRLQSIGDSAFLFCDKLAEIKFPESLKSIGEGAFLHCFNLYDIDLPDSMTHIGVNAFKYTGYYKKPDNWKNGLTLYVGNHLVAIGTSLYSTKFTVDAGTRVIADGVFAKCQFLRTVDFSASVTVIGKRAFEGCTSLEYLNFPTNSELKVIHSEAILNSENVAVINYGNSMAEWNAIQKDKAWSRGVSDFIISCSDGKIYK